MAYKAQKIGNVKGLGDIYQVTAYLDHQLLAFTRVGINSLAAPDEVAQIRLVGVSNDYSRTSIAPIAINGGKTVLVRDSPLMNPLMASAAVKAHANGRYFETSKEVYEAAEALANSQDSLAPEDRSALIVSQAGDFQLTSEMPESLFILRKQAKPYFGKFTQGQIPFCGITSSSKDSATINYLGFSSPRVDSGLSCGYRSLGGDGRAFGVLDSLAKRAHKKPAILLVK